jgi:hypothetical protein
MKETNDGTLIRVKLPVVVVVLDTRRCFSRLAFNTESDDRFICMDVMLMKLMHEINNVLYSKICIKLDKSGFISPNINENFFSKKSTVK